jgi:hypothetical protein
MVSPSLPSNLDKLRRLFFTLNVDEGFVRRLWHPSANELFVGDCLVGS